MQSRFIFTFVLVGFWVGCGSGDLISGDDSSSTGDVVFADTNDGNDLSVSGDDGTRDLIYVDDTEGRDTVSPDSIEPERQEGPVRRGHVTVPDSNRRWASDLTTVWTDQEGIVGVTVVIDCGDRTMLDIEVAKSQESSAVLRPILRALRTEFGTPGRVPDALELRTDHGSVYTGGDCFALTQTWGLKHTFAPVGRPTGNAVAERVIRTLKEELIWTRDWKSIDELRRAVDTWRLVYNHKRPHQALNWQTPEERRCANLGIPLTEVA